MSSVKKVGKNEYDVVITVSREQARMIHKLIGALAAGPEGDLYDQLSEILGHYGSGHLLVGNAEFVTNSNVNNGYPED